jgi:hypothetical protein
LADGLCPCCGQEAGYRLRELASLSREWFFKKTKEDFVELPVVGFSPATFYA